MTEVPRASGEPQLARLDPAAIAQALATRLERTRELRERAATLTGTASSADGHVTVVVDSAGRLTDVSLDPRAMRYASTDLAHALVATTRDAVRNLEEQSAEAVGDPQGARIDIESAQAMLAELGTEFRTQAGDAGAQFDRLHRRLTEGR